MTLDLDHFPQSLLYSFNGSPLQNASYKSPTPLDSGTVILDNVTLQPKVQFNLTISDQFYSDKQYFVSLDIRFELEENGSLNMQQSQTTYFDNQAKVGNVWKCNYTQK